MVLTKSNNTITVNSKKKIAQLISSQMNDGICMIFKYVQTFLERAMYASLMSFELHVLDTPKTS